MITRLMIFLGGGLALATGLWAIGGSCIGTMTCPDQPKCKLYNELATCTLSVSDGEKCEIYTDDRTYVKCEVTNDKGDLLRMLKTECTVCLGTGTGGGSGTGGTSTACLSWDCLTGPLDQSGWCPIWYTSCGI